MNARVIPMVLLIVAVPISMAAAKGQEDSPWETVELTGRITFEDWPHPEFSSGGKSYELMIPPPGMDIEVEPGQTIMIEGYRVEPGQLPEGTDSEYLMVTKAVVNGKEYDLSRPSRDAGPDGRSGMRGRAAPQRDFAPRRGSD